LHNFHLLLFSVALIFHPEFYTTHKTHHNKAFV
jgi:hypothetical protein